VITIYQCPDPPASASVANPAASNVGGWALLAIAVAVVVLELWLRKTRRPTVSQWMRKRRKTWRALAGGLVGLLLYHLLFGGPL
jgi:drug/metabolite transporter (DMT)-like permease